MTDKLQEYAQLLINVGLNVQKDQYVVISSQVDCAYFARMCIAAAYEAGAKQVIMNWNDVLANPREDKIVFNRPQTKEQSLCRTSSGDHSTLGRLQGKCRIRRENSSTMSTELCVVWSRVRISSDCLRKA